MPTAPTTHEVRARLADVEQRQAALFVERANLAARAEQSPDDAGVAERVANLNRGLARLDAERVELEAALGRLAEQDARREADLLRLAAIPGAQERHGEPTFPAATRAPREQGRHVHARDDALRTVERYRNGGELTSTAADRLEPNPRVDEIRHLTPDEVRAVVAAIPNGPYRVVDGPLILTAAMTGMRQGEAIALDWKAVDWERQRIHVRASITRKRKGTPKTARSSRSVPMAPDVAAALDRLTRERGDRGLVFADPHTDGPLLPTPLLRRYRTYLQAAGLPVRYRWHDLRHTFGVAMASAGEPLTAIKEWMGHTDLKTTQIYARWTPGRDEADRIARAFAPVDPRSGAVAPLAAPLRENLSALQST